MGTKINDLSAASAVTESMQLETDTGGTTAEKVTGAQIKTYITSSENTYTAAQQVGTVTLTDGANISVDASLGNVFEVTLGGNRTLDNPTNLVDGQTFIFRVIQDGTGSRTLSYGTAYRFPGGTEPTLSTDANAVDYLTGVSDGTNVDLVFSGAFA